MQRSESHVSHCLGLMASLKAGQVHGNLTLVVFLGREALPIRFGPCQGALLLHGQPPVVGLCMDPWEGKPKSD